MSKTDELKSKNENLFERNTILLNENERLQKENAELKEELQKWKDEWQEQVQKATDEGYARILQTIQLTKAKDLIDKLLHCGFILPCYKKDVIIVEAEQFINEVEK